MIVIGLTGSIGMGKSTAGAMFETLGAAVHDADTCVHELLRYDSPVWAEFVAAFPYYRYPQIYGKIWRWDLWRKGFSPWWREINRKALGKLVFHDDAQRQRLEAVLHPHVKEAQVSFIKAESRKGRKIVVLDIPLLFETGSEALVEYTAVVSAPEFMQRERVLARPNMSAEKFEAIVARQMSDGEKCARADFIIHSGLGRGQMMRDIKAMLAAIRKSRKNAAGEEAA